MNPKLTLLPSMAAEGLSQEVEFHNEALTLAPKGNHLIFVYGTLMRGMDNHWHLKDSPFVRSTQTDEGWKLYSLGLPFMVPSAYGKVWGEVYEVSPEVLQHLDMLEGHPHFYTRTPLKLQDRVTLVEAYIHSTPPRGAQLIKSGSWRSK